MGTLLAVLLSQAAGASVGPVKSYVALGDSFTIGTGSSEREAFPEMLRQRLATGAGLQLHNLGVNGFTTDDLIAVELPQLSHLGCDLVTLAIGANDIVHGRDVASYRENLRTIFTALRQHGVSPARTLTLPQPDWALSPEAAAFGEAALLEARIRIFNQALAEESAKAGARYVDLYPLMTTQARSGLLSADGLHPSAEAYRAWAESLATTLADP